MALDHNLANAHGLIGLAKYFLGRGEETEAHIHEALRLSSPSLVAAHNVPLNLAVRRVPEEAVARSKTRLARRMPAGLTALATVGRRPAPSGGIFLP